MLAFHLDMKAGQYRADYLRSLFRRLAAARYTHVFFEIEDKVRLETIRDAEWCEAFSKEEFAALLAAARAAGLVPVPLIQTLGHLEFLLSHGRYHAWRETPRSAYMLCPSNADAVKHLQRMMDEVGELFNNPPYIHLGADEVQLGACPDCHKRVAASSQSGVFIEHLNTLARHALSRGWRPIAWADVALGHPEAIGRTERDLIWMDWDYWTPEQRPDTLISWRGKHGFLKPDQLDPEFRAHEGRHALDADGFIRPWFYTDYLRENGFDVILAPAMRCGGDHVFAPRRMHLPNVTGACLRLKRTPAPLGMMITSWALRLNPLEAQWPGFLIPMLAAERNPATWQDLRDPLAEQVFGRSLPEFFDAWEKIGTSLVLAESHLGIESQTHYYGPSDTIPYLLERFRKEGRLEKEAEELKAKIPSYQEGETILAKLAGTVAPDSACFRFWQFAGRAIHQRARAYALMLASFAGQPDQAAATQALLAEERLRDEYRPLLSEIYMPVSVERELGMIFGSSLRHLLRLANGRG